jgi:hypothetical protein
MNKKELTKEQKLKLLELYFKDKTIIKAIADTLDEIELNKFIYNNLDEILINALNLDKQEEEKWS